MKENISYFTSSITFFNCVIIPYDRFYPQIFINTIVFWIRYVGKLLLRNYAKFISSFSESAENMGRLSCTVSCSMFPSTP